MEQKQTINCTVKSCEYQNDATKTCTLKAVQIAPMPNCNSKESDESMCASYKCIE